MEPYHAVRVVADIFHTCPCSVKSAVGREGRAHWTGKAQGLALGNITRNWDQARELYKRGYQFLTLTSETSLLVQGAAEILGKFKQEVRPA